MSDSDHPAGDERPTAPEYGPDWVGLDGDAMRTRRELQQAKQLEALAREAARRREDEERLQEQISRIEERQGSTGAGASESRSRRDRGAGSIDEARPTALINTLRVENLRSFVGLHEIPLAPLTFVFGQNSAGKSSLLNALKIFARVVDSGRHDALHAWQSSFKASGPRDLITYEEPDPEDPAGVSWRSALMVGIDFMSSRGEKARAELRYSPNPVGYVDWHASGIGTLEEEDLSRKEFGPEDPDPSPVFLAESFGEHPYARFVVRESHAGGDWTSESRVVDPFLFAHHDRRLQEDVYSMAYLLRYLGPHRGEPGNGYEPQQGPFSIEPRSQGFSADYRSFGIGDFGRFEVLNQMLSQLEIPYEFEPGGPDSDRQGASRPHFRDPDRPWGLIDTRSGTPVTLGQVGYGVSQLLPVVDVCVHARDQVICVEEPELHLHPRLQAKLGNLFTTSVLKRRNQVILETHSENILLRARRLIRSGKLRPDEVAVLYVDNTPGVGASVRRLRLGEHGELLDPWPTGFFDDSLADILGVTR